MNVQCCDGLLCLQDVKKVQEKLSKSKLPAADTQERTKSFEEKQSTELAAFDKKKSTDVCLSKFSLICL